MFWVCSVCTVEVVLCRGKKTGERRGSQAREQCFSFCILIFVLNRMPIAGDKSPAFLRRIQVPGEAYNAEQLLENSRGLYFVLVISSNTLIWTIILSIYVSRMRAPLQYGAPFFAPRPLSSLRCLRPSPRITRECFCSYGGC